MLKLSVNMHRRYPGHEVKAVMTFDDLAVKSKEFKDNLKKLRDKLEQIIPASLRVKYVVFAEGLSISARVTKLSEAQRLQYQLNEYIRAAAVALQFKLVA